MLKSFKTAAVRKHYPVKSFDRRITFRYTPDIIDRMRTFSDRRLKEMGFSPASVTRAVRRLDRDLSAPADYPAAQAAAMSAFLAGQGD